MTRVRFLEQFLVGFWQGLGFGFPVAIILIILRMADVVVVLGAPR